MKGKFKYLRIIMALALCFLMMCIPLNSVSECESHSWKDGKPATCTEAGSRICTVCGIVEETGTVAHSWKDGKPATCTEAGSRICTVCGIVEETGTVAHSWKDGKPATCAEAGSRICTVCGIVEEIGTIAHSWKDGKPATCAEAGSRICTVCGIVEETGIVAHSWKDGKPATCAEAGNRICTVCGNTEEIPMISHSWKHGKDASCTENGNSICTVCGAIDIIPALGHEWKEGAGSSCTKDGNRLCVVCGEVEIIPASGHSYTRYTVEATTTTQGYTRNTCRNCGYVYYSNYTPVIVPDSAIDVDALAYGGIVTDKEDMPVEYTEEVNEAGMLTIVSDLSENDEKAVRKLHLSSTLIEQLKADGIVTVRFENGALAVEFELTVFDGKLAQDIYKDVDGAEGFIVIIDPEKLDDLKPYVEFYLMRDPVDIFLSKAIENYRVFENGDPI